MNDGESFIKKKLEHAGWTVLRNGFPDFFAFRIHGKHMQFMGAEVKGKNECLLKSQILMKMTFELAGIPYRVFRYHERDIAGMPRRLLLKKQMDAFDITKDFDIAEGRLINSPWFS